MNYDLETSVIEGLKTGEGSIERALLVVSGLVSGAQEPLRVEAF